ncbi:MAG: hypothetical protein ABI680_00905, partial [Chthoniobacteraceae bacterium]
ATSALASVGNDPLRSESDLFAALQNFTAEDFQRLTRDAAAFEKLTKSLDKSWEVKRAFIAGFIERWLEVDEPAAFAWFASEPKLIKAGNNFDNTAVAAFARVRPEGLLAQVLKMPEGGDRKRVATTLIFTIGETDLAKAKEWAARFEDKATRDAAEQGYRSAWAKIDPFGAVAAASKLPGREGDRVWNAAMMEAVRRGAGAALSLAETAKTESQIRYATYALTRADPAAAAQLIAANPDKFSNDFNFDSAQRTGTEFAALDRDRAREWADALPEKMRIAALGAVANVWAATDARAAMEWLTEHPAREAADPAKPTDDPKDASMEVFSAWLGRDEAAARAYAAALPAGEAREAADVSLISYCAENGRTEEAAALLAQSGDLQGGALAGRVAEAMARDDPMAAAAWAASLPPGPNQTKAIQAAAGAWTGRDPASVANWIEQFPVGEVRDKAVGVYVQRIAAMDAPAAAEWVMQVSDPWQRGSAARSVFWQMRQRDPDGAAKWFSTLPGIDETLRRITLLDSK